MARRNQTQNAEKETDKHQGLDPSIHPSTRNETLLIRSSTPSVCWDWCLFTLCLSTSLSSALLVAACNQHMPHLLLLLLLLPKHFGHVSCPLVSTETALHSYAIFKWENLIYLFPLAKSIPQLLPIPIPNCLLASISSHYYYWPNSKTFASNIGGGGLDSTRLSMTFYDCIIGSGWLVVKSRIVFSFVSLRTRTRCSPYYDYPLTGLLFLDGWTVGRTTVNQSHTHTHSIYIYILWFVIFLCFFFYFILCQWEREEKEEEDVTLLMPLKDNYMTVTSDSDVFRGVDYAFVAARQRMTCTRYRQSTCYGHYASYFINYIMRTVLCVYVCVCVCKW